jgi:hypothetical protein
MIKDIRRYLWLSQISLLGFLAICSLIIPSVAINNGGVSNFGNHSSTVVFYTLSFSLSALFLGLVAIKLIRISRSLRRMASLLLLICLLDLVVLISTFPRHISWTYSVIHDDLGIVLFSYEFVLGVWFVIRRKHNNTLLIFLIELVGSLIALLTVLKFFHLLFVGQAIAGLGFGLLLVTCFPSMVGPVLVDKEKS